MRKTVPLLLVLGSLTAGRQAGWMADKIRVYLLFNLFSFEIAISLLDLNKGVALLQQYKLFSKFSQVQNVVKPKIFTLIHTIKY